MKWGEVFKCLSCGKVYRNSVPEICFRCGIRIAKEDGFLSLLGVEKCCYLTENAVKLAGRKRIFRKWEFKELN